MLGNVNKDFKILKSVNKLIIKGGGRIVLNRILRGLKITTHN